MRARMHLVLAVSCVVAFAASGSQAWAGRITLNDTGVTQCVDHRQQWSAECTRSRQDAAYGRDVTDADPDDGIAGFSFRKVCRSGQAAGEGSCPADPALGNGPNDWGCTYDNIRALTWEVKTADGGIHDYQRLYTNKGGGSRDEPSDAAWLVAATNGEGLCGATNWRLPGASELQSIVNYGRAAPDQPSGPLVDPTFFPFDRQVQTWTHDERFDNSQRAWYVSFNNGAINIDQRSSSGAARLVHSGANASELGQRALAKGRFVPSADGTEVSDTLTGLVWRRCAAGMAWHNDAQTCSGAATEFGWNGALDYVRANREGGWRLPNAKELFSIVDIERGGPAIDEMAFPNTPNFNFLSTTPSGSFTDPEAYAVNFFYGGLYQESLERLNPIFIRLVRKGRK
jgi:hypothetical protein